MYITREIGCCGIREIGALSIHQTAKQAMAAFAKGTIRKHENFRYALFSEAQYCYELRNRPYGRDFAAFIKANKLGKVATTTWNVNPNSGNKLKAWIWTVDWDALKAWAKRNRVAVSKAELNGTLTPAVPGLQVAEAVNR